MRFLCFNNQIQTIVLNKGANDVDLVEGGYQDDETIINDTPYWVRCPWQFRFGLDAKWVLKLVFGRDNDTALKVYQNHPISHPNQKLSDQSLSFPNHVRLFWKLPQNTAPGIHPNDNNLDVDGVTQLPGDVVTHNMVTSLDQTDYSLSYEVDMDIETNKLRLRSLPIVVDDFIPDVMNKARFAYPSKTTYLQQQKIICVKFLPVARSYQSYQGWNNGLHLQFADDGPKTIQKKGVEDYLIFAGQTITTSDVIINRGQPYKLNSDSIEVDPGTNMILHIWKDA